MPSALETLVKILKLEREQGCKNSAVIGGLSAYGRNWTTNAHAQARKPEHHNLVNELSNLLEKYDGMENRTERNQTINYMLDRITGRVPPPPEYQVTSAPPERSQLMDLPPSAEMTHVETHPPAGNVETQAADIQATSQAGVQAVQQVVPMAETSTVEPKADVPQREQSKSRDYRKPDDRRTDTRPNRQGDTRQRDGGQKNRPGSQQGGYKGGNKPNRPFKGDDEGDDEGGEFSGRFEDEMSADDFMSDSFTRGPRTFELDIPPLPRLERAPRRPHPPLDPEEAADIMRGLNASVESVKGVGPGKSKLLNKLGIDTINDFLFFLPRRYDDYTRLVYISRLKPNMTVTVIGTVLHIETRIARSGRKDFYMELDDGSGVLNIIFFSQHWLIQKIRRGMQLVVRGTTSIYGSRLQMTNPEWEELDSENLRKPSIVPIYPLTEGLKSTTLRSLMKKTVEYWADRLPDYIPEATLDRAELGDLGWAIKNLHFPEGTDHLEHARNRYIFDQLLLLQLSILAQRRDWQSVPAQALPVTDDFVEPFIESVFPYALTGAQRRAIDDIRRDIATTTPMNRLIQGDVGSGKTAVAITAMAMAFVNGKQAALMAPTSILAEQHYRNISRVLTDMPGERRPVIGLLTSALTISERESIYRGLADGSIDIIIGTHALIQAGVEFKDLGLAVIDEQHRFGVEQRGALRGKGTNPHLLVMTATPIPRTLALTLYADLDLTVMDEMPPGRIPIQTRVVEPIARERIYSFVESQLKEGRQAFIVHPLVESSENIDARSAIEAFDQLKKVFFRYKVGLLHGRMKPAEKDDAMAAFTEGGYDILVTTSVAEVGVDVPNASVIVIEGANRFGLAQLHQFRGRVGRGGYPSYCLLIPDTNAPDAMERLEALEATTDGFKLAEVDWTLRGPGDLVGTRQSGQTSLQLAEAITPHLVELAQREARTIYEEDAYLQQPQHRLLAQRVAMLYNEGSDVS